MNIYEKFNGDSERCREEIKILSVNVKNLEVKYNKIKKSACIDIALNRTI